MRGRHWERLETLEQRQFLSAVSWDGGGGDLDWHNPLNWSGDVLPGPDDDVLINVPGAPVITHAGGSTSVRSLTSTEALSITGGSTISVETLWRQIGGLTLRDSTITGAGDLLLNADAYFDNATIAGSGNAILWHGRTAVVDGSLTLSRTMTNVGTIRWQAGSITLDSTLTSLPGALFQITLGAQMEGSGTFVNAGKVTKVGTWSTPTNIRVTFSNRAAFDVGAWPYWPDPLGSPDAGIVEVLSGILSFTGNVLEKQGSVLRSGHWWVNTITEGTLILPGPGIETIPYLDPEHRQVSIVLKGEGSSFPQLSTATSIALLILENHDLPSAVLSNVDRLTLNNAGTTHAPGLRTVRALDLPRGRLIVGDFHVDTAHIGEGAELTVTGLMSMDGAASAGGLFVIESLTGVGTLRITGTLQMQSGSVGVGTLLIGPTGRLELSEYNLFRQTGGSVSSRVVNYGEIDVSFPRTWLITTELVNRGQFSIRAAAAFAVDPISPAAHFHNFGTVTVLDGSLVTFRGAGGGVRFFNHGEVHTAAGTLRIFGGGGGGGVWYTAAGSELTFGGLDAALRHATISGNGGFRIGANLSFESGQVTGAGPLFVGPQGHLRFRGGLGTLPDQQNSISRSLVTNNGTIAVAENGRATIGAPLTNNSTLDLAGPLQAGIYTSGDESAVRFRMSETQLFTFIVGAPAVFRGSLLIDFNWAVPAGAFFDVIRVMNTFAPGTVTGFSQVQGVGLPPGSGITLLWWSQQFVLNGRVSVT